MGRQIHLASLKYTSDGILLMLWCCIVRIWLIIPDNTAPNALLCNCANARPMSQDLVRQNRTENKKMNTEAS